MPAIPKRSYPLCVSTIFANGVRRYTLQSATQLAVDAWLVHLSAWYHEMTLDTVPHKVMRILLDLRSAKSLPIAQITRVLPQWQAAHPDCRLYIGVVMPDNTMLKLSQNFVGTVGMHEAFAFFGPGALEQAHTWLNQS